MTHNSNQDDFPETIFNLIKALNTQELHYGQSKWNSIFGKVKAYIPNDFVETLNEKSKTNPNLFLDFLICASNFPDLQQRIHKPLQGLYKFRDFADGSYFRYHVHFCKNIFPGLLFQQKETYVKFLVQEQKDLQITNRSAEKVNSYLSTIYIFMKETKKTIELTKENVALLVDILNGDEAIKEKKENIMKMTLKILTMTETSNSNELVYHDQLQNFIDKASANIPETLYQFCQTEQMRRFAMRIYAYIGTKPKYGYIFINETLQNYICTQLSNPKKLSQKEIFDILKCFKAGIQHFGAIYNSMAINIGKIALTPSTTKKIRQYSIDLMTILVGIPSVLDFLTLQNISMISRIFLLPYCNKKDLFQAFKERRAFLLGSIEHFITNSKSFQQELTKLISLLQQIVTSEDIFQKIVRFVINRFKDIEPQDIEKCLELYQLVIKYNLVSRVDIVETITKAFQENDNLKALFHSDLFQFVYKLNLISFYAHSKESLPSDLNQFLLNMVASRCEDWQCTPEFFMRDEKTIVNINSSNSLVNSFVIQLFYSSYFHSFIFESDNTDIDLITALKDIFTRLIYLQKKSLNIESFLPAFQLVREPNDLAIFLTCLNANDFKVAKLKVSSSEFTHAIEEEEEEQEQEQEQEEEEDPPESLIYELERTGNVPFHFPGVISYNDKIKYRLAGVITKNGNEYSSIIRVEDQWYDFYESSYIDSTQFHFIVSGGDPKRIKRYALFLFYENEAAILNLSLFSPSEETKALNDSFILFRYLFKPSVAEIILSQNKFELICQYFVNFVCHSNFDDSLIEQFISNIQNNNWLSYFYPFFSEDPDGIFEIIINNRSKKSISLFFMKNIFDFFNSESYNKTRPLMNHFIENLGKLGDHELISEAGKLIDTFLKKFHKFISSTDKTSWLSNIQSCNGLHLESSSFEYLSETYKTEQPSFDSILKTLQKGELSEGDLSLLVKYFDDPSFPSLINVVSTFIPFLINSKQEVRDDAEKIIHHLFKDIPDLENYEKGELIKSEKKFINVHSSTDNIIVKNETATRFLRSLLSKIPDFFSSNDLYLSHYFRVIHWLKIRLNDDSIKITELFDLSRLISESADHIELLHLMTAFRDDQIELIDLNAFFSFLFLDENLVDVAARFVLFLSLIRTPEQMISILGHESFPRVFESLDTFQIYQPYCYFISKFCKLIGSDITKEKLQLINAFSLLLANNLTMIMNAPHLNDGSICFMKILKSLSPYFTSEIVSRFISNFYNKYDPKRIDNEHFEVFILSLKMNEIAEDAAQILINHYFDDLKHLTTLIDTSHACQNAYCDKFKDSLHNFNDHNKTYLFMKCALKSENMQTARVSFFIESITKLDSLVTFLNSFDGKNCLRIVTSLLKVNRNLFDSIARPIEQFIQCLIDKGITIKCEIQEFLSICLSKIDVKEIRKYCDLLKSNLQDENHPKFNYSMVFFKMIFTKRPDLIDEFPLEYDIIYDISN